MNKKFISYILTVLLCLTNYFPCFAKDEENNIFSSSKTIEEYINLEGLKIDDFIPFETIYTIYEQQCTEKSIMETKSLVEKIIPTRSENIKSYQIPFIMQKRFYIISYFIPQIKHDNKDNFCKQKYMFRKLLETSQTSYIQSLNPTYTRPSPIHWSAANSKKELSTKFINIKNNTSNLNNENKQLAEDANKYIQKEIWNLIELKLLNTDDLQVLNNKISINYKLSCENTKWSFHITQNKWWTNKQFKSIELNINLCDSKSFKDNYENYVKQIFIHEISHYIYVFKDNNYKDFSKICWWSWNTCSKSDFVSNYAQNNEAEDYAESLAYRYLDNFNWINKQKWSASTKKLWEKLLYFNDLLQRLQ